MLMIAGSKLQAAVGTAAYPQAVSCLAVLPHSCRDSGLAEGDAIHVVGSLPSLGAWKQEQAPRMTRLAASHWQLEVLT